MKKHFLILAALVLAVVTFMVVSCKKDNTPTNQDQSPSKQAYQPPKVDNMEEYLKEFKQKMQLRENEETMDLDEASWHLTSIANYDFGDVKAGFTNLKYDTLYAYIAVNNGTVSLADLNTAYASVYAQIESFYQALDLENPRTYFIEANIDNCGLITVTLMTSFYDYIWDHTWYFPTLDIADSILDIYIGDSIYSSQEVPGVVKRVLNILTSYTNAYGQDNSMTGRVFYVVTRMDSLDYTAYVDPEHSPFINDYRIWYLLGAPGEVENSITRYCIDSYAGLGLDELNADEVIIHWPLIRYGIKFAPLGYTYHVPYIQYGREVEVQDQPEH